jgi:hypothetical protein
MNIRSKNNPSNCAICTNEKFFVCCANNGRVYTARGGDSTFTSLKNIKPELSVFYQNETPRLSISFLTDENQYWTIIYEQIMGQSAQVKIPVKIPR